MNANNNLGNDVFTAIENLSVVGQVTGYRALANSAVCGAVFLSNTLLSWDGPTDDTGELTPTELRQLEFYQSLPQRICAKAELYDVACDRLLGVAQSDFDKPMSLEDAIDFAATQSTAQVPAELPQEILEALGITKAQLALIDSQETQRRQAEVKKLRASVQINRAGIASQVGSYLSTAHSEQDVIAQIDVDTMGGLYQKVSQKLSGGIGRALAKRDRYENALGDAMMLSRDLPTLDASYKAFLKETRGASRDERGPETQAA